MTPPSQPSGRGTMARRRHVVILLVAAFVSFLLSPLTATLALVAGPLVAMLAWPFVLLGNGGAKQVLYAAAGVILGALPIFAWVLIVGTRSA